MILEDIFRQSKQDLERTKEKVSFKHLEKKFEELSFRKNPKDICTLLRKNPHKINIIAEVKKASPSKGVIREDFKPLQIALNYASNSACAISVLTESHFFQGELSFLQEIRKSVDIPLLRKDFIFDLYQILQSAVCGADFILLIAKMLDEKSLKNLFEYARNLGLEVLFEVHSKEDLQKAFFAGANIIGINHRDLNDFSMNMSLCEELMQDIPKDKIIVAESGLDDRNIHKLDDLGVDAFLIGEYLMREKDEGLALSKLKRRL
ncbi:indole-3-glycerol phosphate synthase TrpC [Campylobacter sp. MIT 99-7217]|uniref:indole-3-glycerol phosphate synthase TrpC n=1 Tax=Campylobacter sp. MIT 99-7217 TaxID=535091 RepID=UPI001157687D|nr:indole-3-glycerol phosphate synthase TrpC [Campylobacter sp. MIT 99-7217]TQR34540.1 indole-3-glycerol phosphate synthase TrpC [Campylobacter sp. MIT 99-7217]